MRQSARDRPSALQTQDNPYSTDRTYTTPTARLHRSTGSCAKISKLPTDCDSSCPAASTARESNASSPLLHESFLHFYCLFLLHDPTSFTLDSKTVYHSLFNKSTFAKKLLQNLDKQKGENCSLPLSYPFKICSANVSISCGSGQSTVISLLSSGCGKQILRQCSACRAIKELG
mgnify:CR=1 FL=1